MTNSIRANLVTLYGAGALQSDVNLDKEVTNLSGGDFDTPDCGT